ncbi:MAG: acyl-CoA dehydrogenase family protein [Candidatus Brocadiia bacterium]
MFNLTEEQRLIRDTARDFARSELAKVAKDIDRDQNIPDEIIKKLGEIGFWGILVPEQYGGAGLDLLSLVLALEEISHVCASTSVTLSVHNSLVCNALIKYGTEAQKRKYLPDLASGKIIGAYALTEPNSGSDAASLQSTAVKKGDKYILNGTKTFLTNGQIAGLIVAFARTNPSVPKNKGISAFLVDADLPGLKRGPKEDKMGVRGAAACELVFDDTPVPAGNMLDKEDHGFDVAMGLLNSGRIGIATQCVGIAQACLDDSLKYCQERVQFDKKISEFEAIRWKLAEMATDIEASRLLTYQAAVLRDGGLPHTKQASMAKLFASTMCNKAAKEAIQIYGGWGYIKEFSVERYFRDAKVTEIYEGTSEIQKLVISRELLGNK